MRSQRASSRLWGIYDYLYGTYFRNSAIGIGVEETSFLNQDLKKILEVSFYILENQIIFLVTTELVKILKIIAA